MDKGSRPAGNTTTTTVNPTQQAQLPFLQNAWGTAQSLYNQDPTQYAPPSPQLTQGYNDLYNTGVSVDQTLRPATNAAFQNAISGGMGVQNSPAYSYLQSFAQGTSAPQQRLEGIGQAAQDAGGLYAPQAAGYGAQAAAGGGPGLDQLAASARGDYLNSNPYISAAVSAAQDPVTRAYQTATAPQTDANFAGAGRYGSGALLGARGQNEQNLGRALGDISTNMYNADYGRERTLQDQAASQYGQIRNQGFGLGIQGADAASNIMNRGLNTALGATGADLTSQVAGAGALQSGYQAGNQAQLEALRQSPQVMAEQFYPTQQEVAAQTALQGQQQNQINAPYNALSRYLTQIGQPTGGSGTVSQPYFQNQTANALSALTGVGGLANTLGGGGGLGGLGGLFGGGSGGLVAGAPGVVSGSAADALIGSGLAADASGGLGLETLASAAPIAAAGGWIICTELMRQGRMPKKHWAAGIALFDAYPEGVKRGYYAWAIPTVRHLRKHPDSSFSKFIGAIAKWRSENIAAKRGVRGARRLWRGTLVSAIGYPICAALGCVVPPQDWQAVYQDELA